MLVFRIFGRGCAGAALIGSCLIALAEPARSASITDLTTNSCGLQNVSAINASGEVAGFASLQPTACSGGVQTVLPAGGVSGGSGVALGINTSGQIVGEIGNQAFLYSGGNTSAIDPFGTSGFSNAYGINDSGQIVGNYRNTIVGSTDAYLYSGGVFTDLNTLSGLAQPGNNGTSYAFAINGDGQIVGLSAGNATYPVQFAYLDSGGVTTRITPSASCIGGSTATAINSSGQVAGSFRLCGSSTGASHAFLYSGGVTTDLGSLGDSGASSFANGINDGGEVVGYSNIPGNDNNNTGDYDAFLYSNGVMIDLTSLLPANSGFMRLEDAVAINNSGQIIGYGVTTTGETDSFLLDTGAAPTPEPGSLALLGAGLAIVALRSRRKKIPLDKV